MKRLLLLFLDGADFGFIRRAFDQGLLPNIAALTGGRGPVPLATSTPAESPVAFAEVLTACNPGKHGLFDFLHRDPETYWPHVALYRRTSYGYENALRVPTLCEPLAAAGVRTALLRIPSTFPPPRGADLVLSGLGVPDAAGAWGMAQRFGLTPPADETFGARGAAYETDGETWRLPIDTPGGRVTLTVERAGKAYAVNGLPHPVERFGPWLEIPWPGGRGVATLHPSADAEPVFTLTPIWSHPADLTLPAAHPASLWRERAARVPLAPIAGWPEPSLLYARGHVGLDAYAELCERCAAQFEEILFEVLADRNVDCVIANHELFDRMAHAGFGETADARVEAALAGVLIRFDALVGRARELFDDLEIWLASDHGFAPWTRRVNVNRWFADNGYLVGVDSGREPGLTDLSDGFGAGIDWSRTRAYGVGLSKVYLNLEGRESKGIVPRGREERRLKAELIERLSAWIDPATGKRVFRRVLDARRTYWGGAVDLSADLVLCYEPGYRTDWTASLGGASSPALADNASNWRADHCGVDPACIPGFAAFPFEPGRAGIALMDLAPSILRRFGVEPPSHWDGRAVRDKPDEGPR